MTANEAKAPATPLAFGLCAAAVGAFGLLGWAFDLDFLKSPDPAWTTMKPNTALCVIFLGLALAAGSSAESTARGKAARLAASRAFAGAAIAITLATLAQFVLGVDTRIDELLFPEDPRAIMTTFPGRMAVPTAISIALLGCAAMHRGRRSPATAGRRAGTASVALDLAATLPALFSLLGYAARAAGDYGIGSGTKMAVNTAAALLLLSAGDLLRRRDVGPAELLADRGLSGRIARFFLPLSVLAPALLLGFAKMGKRAGAFDSEYTDVVVTLAYTVVLYLSSAGFVRSIRRSERRREETERELLAERDRLRRAGEMAKVGDWEFDVATMEGRWSEEVAKIHGLDPSAPTDVALGISFFRGEYRKRIEQAVNGALVGEPYDLELELAPAGGGWKWIRTKGEPVFTEGRVTMIRGIIQDITDIHEARERRDDLERKYRLISENSRDVIWLFDPATGRFTYVSPSVRKLLGMEPEEAMAEDYRASPAPESLSSLMAAMPARAVAFLAGDASAEYGVHEVWQPRKDGSIVPTEVVTTLLRQEDGEGILVLGVSRDISERKRAEERILALNAELEARVLDRTARLEESNAELEAFTFSVSHDLRAPLRRLESLLRDLPPAEAVTLAGGETARLRSLIEDLLKLSRIGNAELFKQEVDLSRLAEEAIGRAAARYPGLDFIAEIEPGLRASCDARLVSIALENLADNALKFSSRSPCAHISFVKSGEEFCMRDKGCGFNARKAELLFSPFQRFHADSEYPGTGIGLSTVLRIVKKHGGRLRAVSEPGQGSEFYFTLP